MTYRKGHQLFLKPLLTYLLTGAIPLLLTLAIFNGRQPAIPFWVIYILVGLSTISAITFSLISKARTTRILETMAETTNHLQAEKEETRAELNRGKIWFQAILNSLSDGLLIIDETGRIIIANTAFQKIIGKENSLSGKFYWELIREPNLAQMLADPNLPKTTSSAEIAIGSRIFLCHTSPVAATGQRVVIFHDITEIVQTERIKKDFVANVSHELRTPLTAIKGYVETIEETVDPDNLPYLQTIKRHTERLITLVADLLTLSRVEDKTAILHQEDIEPAELIAGIATIFRTPAEKKGLSLKTSIAPNLPVIKGDSLQLEQALINLVDNAIRYTEKGMVTITAERQSEQLAISVTDTGIGISEHHLPRIFERFYVVDRSRSRQTGGTGLGLAIVKHIVNQHKGEIRVESSPGVGSKFTILLPIPK